MIAPMVFFIKIYFYPMEVRKKYAISINDLNMAVDYAEQELKDNWETYKQKYLKGI